MELKVRKFDDQIISSCEIIKKCHDHLSSILNDYDYKTCDRAKIDRNIVRMSVASDKIIDLILPIPSAGEIHGLPREATQFGDEPDVMIVDKDNPKWDFRPWFAEKSGALREAINKVMNYLETNPDDLVFHPTATTTPKKHISDMISHNMAEIEHMADAILSMIESGRLAITDVKLEEEE